MIHFLRLERFKSFSASEGDFGPLTLLVGTNASGKSNIREALRVLHGIGLGYPLAEVLGEKYGPGGILQWRGIRGGAREAGFQGAESFILIVDADGPSTAGQLRYWIEIGTVNQSTGPRVIGESLYLAGPDQFVYDSNPEDDPVEQKGDHQLRVRYPRDGRNRRHGKVIELSSTRPALAQLAERGEPTAVRETCRAVMDELASMRFLDLDPEAMRQASPPGQIVMGDRGENLSSVLQSICADPKREKVLLQWVRALTPLDATDFEFRTDFSGRVLVHLKESSGHVTSAVSASDGTLRFLALAAALLSPDTGRIYFFEEFDNGIHPTRLHLLLDLVQRACREQGVQVIGTTHNPAMLAYLDEQARDDALLVYRSEEGGGSKLRCISELPDFEQALGLRDLGRLHQAGWLETAAAFSDEEAG
jgi:predicted ATPase